MIENDIVNKILSIEDTDPNPDIKIEPIKVT